MNATRLGLYAAAVALAVLPAARLSAQDGQLAYHDSLHSFSRADLRATLRQADTAPASTGELLRAGFAAFRLYELDREKLLADSAKKLFEGALAREPGSAWAHYGLGLVLSRGPGIRVSSPGGALDGVVTAQVFAEVFGVDPRARALRELRSALQIDPLLVPALLEMADLAQQERNEETLHEARNALFRATQRISNRRVWLALSWVESALGIADGAQNAAEQLLRADSTDALALHAYARALLAQQGKKEAGVHSYLRGLSHADSAALDLYFDDLRPILNGREVDTWRWLPAADRSLWIRRFWELRAGRAGLTLNERIGEHFARVLEAEQRYRRAAQYGAPPVGSLIVEGLSALPFDDRGIMLIRHGYPMDVVRTARNGFPPNETWVYPRTDSGGFHLYNFLKYPGTADYRLVAQLPPCDSSQHSRADISVRSGVLKPFDPHWVEGVVQYLEDRGKYDARFQRLAARCQASTIGRSRTPTLVDSTGVNFDAADLSLDLQREALIALRTETDHPDFDVRIPFIHRLYAFRTSGDRKSSDVTAALLIPGDRITPAAGTSGARVYQVGLSLVLIDTTAERVMRVDTTLYFESARVLTNEDFLRMHLTLPAPLDGSVQYRLLVRDLSGVSRGGFAAGELQPRRMTGTQLTLSDIVIAESDSGRWERGRVKLALMPPHEIDADRAFVLFYEIYNLPPSSRYTAEVAIEPLKAGAFAKLRGLLGGSGGKLRFRFDGQGEASAVTQVSHRIAGELPPGTYRLRITVRDPGSMQEDSRETQLVILAAELRRSKAEPRGR